MQYNYIGKTCPFCQYAIKSNRDAVLCPACKVSHHRECWVENGGCTTFGCRETSYRPTEGGERLEVSFDEPTGWHSAPARGGGNNKRADQSDFLDTNRKPLWRRLLGFRSLNPWKMAVGGGSYAGAISVSFLLYYNYYTNYIYWMHLGAGYGSYYMDWMHLVGYGLMFLIFMFGSYSCVSIVSAILENRKTWKAWTIIFLFLFAFFHLYLYEYFILFNVDHKQYFIGVTLLACGIISLLSSIMFGLINKKSNYILLLVTISLIILVTGAVLPDW